MSRHRETELIRTITDLQRACVPIAASGPTAPTFRYAMEVHGRTLEVNGKPPAFYGEFFLMTDRIRELTGKPEGTDDSGPERREAAARLTLELGDRIFEARQGTPLLKIFLSLLRNPRDCPRTRRGNAIPVPDDLPSPDDPYVVKVGKILSKLLAEIASFKNLLVEDLAPMVRHLVIENMKAFARSPYFRDTGEPDFEETLQEGSLALLEARDGYVPGNLCKFSTYAWTHVRRRVKSFLKMGTRVVRVPPKLLALREKSARVRESLRRILGRAPEEGEVAGALRISPEKLKRLSELPVREISLDTAAFPDEIPPIEFIADKSAPNPLEELLSQEVRKDFLGRVHSLKTANQVAMICGLFGFPTPEGDRLEPGTMKEIALSMGISPRHANGIFAAGIGNLRKKFLPPVPPAAKPGKKPGKGKNPSSPEAATSPAPEAPSEWDFVDRESPAPVNPEDPVVPTGENPGGPEPPPTPLGEKPAGEYPVKPEVPTGEKPGKDKPDDREAANSPAPRNPVRGKTPKRTKVRGDATPRHRA
jgi:DNA-directed RNA polymerase specialized sigma subunit